MKGILLAGGKGSRLYPVTSAFCKQLLPVYDKPMIYYPLSTLMLAGIQEILIISTPEDLPRIEKLFGSGESFGLRLQYKKQKKPEGIAQALLIGEEFIGNSSVALILGDNIFYGNSLEEKLQKASGLENGALIFGYPVKDPSRYGVIAFAKDFTPLQIVEKPKKAPSEYAVCGLYFFDAQAISFAKNLTPSFRGELEITDINQKYLEKKQLQVEILGRGFAWLDTGTFESLQKASFFVQTLQERQGFQIACLEEVAYRKGFISLEVLQKKATLYEKSEYGAYLRRIVKEEIRNSLESGSFDNASQSFLLQDQCRQ